VSQILQLGSIFCVGIGYASKICVLWCPAPGVGRDQAVKFLTWPWYANLANVLALQLLEHVLQVLTAASHWDRVGLTPTNLSMGLMLSSC